jgi:hypothetical protein
MMKGGRERYCLNPEGPSGPGWVNEGYFLNPEGIINPRREKKIIPRGIIFGIAA